jgi:hypothetical protein
MRTVLTALKTVFGVAAAGFLAASGLAIGCGGGNSEDAVETPAAGGSGGVAGGGAGGASGGKGGSAGVGGAAGGINPVGMGGAAGTGTGLPDKCTASSECKGFECCGGQCVDPKSDVLNCGKCGTKCDGAEKGLGFCNQGACNKCDAGKADCNAKTSDQCEVTLTNDIANCGACGHSCLLANVEGATCESSACKIGGCKPGFADCDLKPETGCEGHVSNDPENCGACGKKCPVVANANATCELGACGKFVCKDGFADCDGKPENGCEVDLSKDLANCGACKAPCDAVPNGQAKCDDGICVIGACTKGFDDCDKSSGNGCETDLSTNVDNCAACGQKCPGLANSEASCKASMCNSGKCLPGFDDCDAAMPGCESNLATSVSNCGACGNACPDIAHGKPVCQLFLCGIGSCDPGFGDCVGGAEDGCETSLQDDVTHCGSCDTVCPEVYKGTKACLDGKCGISFCEGTFADCNNTAFDGCETDVSDDKENCGACGMACVDHANSIAACVAGKCAIAQCTSGTSDCDGNIDNGCELPTDFDPKNCGGCGIVCGSGSCIDGACECEKKVLLIADDSQSETTTLADALKAEGLQVVQTMMPVWQYKGDPAPMGSEFGAVLVLSGGPAVDPTNNSFTADMPIEGQQAIVDFVSASNGLVLTEWAALHAAKQNDDASDQWALLRPYILLQRTLAFSGLVTYSVDAAFANHPLWKGLPASFTFGSTSNVGITKLGSGNKRVASSPEALDAVAIRDEPNQGRIVHVAHAGNYQPNGWGNANVQKLIANSVLWAARCTK